MQPLLLFKQTLEATYDPGILKLDGPNVYFENYREFFNPVLCNLDLLLSLNDKGHTDEKLIWNFKLVNDEFDLKKCELIIHRNGIKEEYSFDDGFSFFSSTEIYDYDEVGSRRMSDNGYHYELEFERILLNRLYIYKDDATDLGDFIYEVDIPSEANLFISGIIHVPGLRKRPERRYRLSGINNFVGTFDNYVAALIYNWQNSTSLYDKLLYLKEYLKLLGLTGSIAASKVNDSSTSLKVSPLPEDEVASERLVDISDVGYGVSQVLPVLVALIEAKENQMVYIEQPELHLHPNAQYLLAKPFVDAVNRGVNVVMETHSSILLLAIQTAVANGELDPDKVSLNWFQRDPKTGYSTHSTGTLGKDGGFGEWPVDFDDVELRAARMFIEAQNRKT
jgi:hypothetical protein